MFSAFLIDLDGTILDSRKAFIIAYNRTLVRYSLPPLPSDEIKAIQILRRPVDDIFSQLLGEMSKDSEFLETFIDDLKESYGEVYMTHTRLCPSAAETIRQLKGQKHKVGIVTSRLSFADYIMPALNSLGLENMIDLIVTSRDVTITKPSPEPYLLAAQKLKKEIGECVVVGDSPEDVMAGKSAGMLTVAYTGGFYTFEELAKYNADLVIDDLGKLAQLAHAHFGKGKD